MAYSSAILARAEAALKQAQQDHRQREQARREAIYQALPRTREIDQLLRQTAPRILAVSLRQGLGKTFLSACIARVVDRKSVV